MSAKPRPNLTAEPEYWRALDICKRLNISDETWRRWRKAGLTPEPAPMPGVPRWHRADIEDFERRRHYYGREYFRSVRRARDLRVVSHTPRSEQSVQDTAPATSKPAGEAGEFAVGGGR